MSKRLLFLTTMIGLAAVPPASIIGQDKGSTPNAKNEAALDGEWTLDQSYSVYTGREKDALLVSREHKLSIKGRMLEVTGYIEGKKKTVKYTLEVDSTAKPKRFKQTNHSNANDSESGI